MQRDQTTPPVSCGKTERELFIMRQRRWMRLVKAGDWTGMAQHVKAVRDYDSRAR